VLLCVFRLYPVEYHCPWNPARVERVLRSLGQREVESILAEKSEVVVNPLD
jgi:redox-regulated HSP33 family molecular chaperone